jgi:hypothetical protein
MTLCRSRGEPKKQSAKGKAFLLGRPGYVVGKAAVFGHLVGRL